MFERVCERVVVIVHHDGERLAQYERAPHDDVPPARAHALLREPRYDRQRRLRHHAQERPDPEHLQRHAHLHSHRATQHEGTIH